jgi:hypothetical protein
VVGPPGFAVESVALLIVGVSGLVCAIAGTMLQSTVHGWEVVPMAARERLLVAPVALVFTVVGAILVYRRQ